jgi:hypothetical protein
VDRTMSDRKNPAVKGRRVAGCPTTPHYDNSGRRIEYMTQLGRRQEQDPVPLSSRAFATLRRDRSVIESSDNHPTIRRNRPTAGLLMAPGQERPIGCGADGFLLDARLVCSYTHATICSPFDTPQGLGRGDPVCARARRGAGIHRESVEHGAESIDNRPMAASNRPIRAHSGRPAAATRHIEARGEHGRGPGARWTRRGTVPKKG